MSKKLLQAKVEPVIDTVIGSRRGGVVTASLRLSHKSMQQAELQIALDANAFTRFVGYGLSESDTKRANITVEEAMESEALMYEKCRTEAEQSYGESFDDPNYPPEQ